MEDELRCILCKELYVNPVLLPCYHSLCLSCALDIQVQIVNNNGNTSANGNNTNSSATNNANSTANNNNNNNNTTANAVNGGTTTIVTAQVHATPGQLQQQQQQQSQVANQSTAHSSTLPRSNHNALTSSTSGGSSSSSNGGNGIAIGSSNGNGSGGGSSSASESIASDQDTADKVSILSEADSGVICTSRPSSYAGTPNLQALLFPPSGGAVYSLTCPICRKMVFFDDAGARNLSPYRTMESIIDRFCEREALRCQMCEIDPKIAAVVCEQCEIRYCETCRELCHPARGPLAKHMLTAPRGGAISGRETVCVEHTSETLTLFCLTCKLALCQQCVGDNRHQSHDIQSIAAICKSQKVSCK